MASNKLDYPDVTVITHLPRWLWDRLLAESKRRGSGYMRLIAAALERELVHGGQPVEMPGTEREADKR